MKTVYLAIIFTLLMVGLFANTCQAADYILAPGDVINISVWGHDELQVKDLTVRPDGKISFPLVGEVDVKGSSSAQLADIITKSLSAYVKDPQTIVNVAKFRTTRVYVLGEVSRPGLYEIEKQHNLIDAIGIAGGYTSLAAKKKVYIIKRDKPDKPIEANLLNFLQKADLSQNYTLDDGDVVYLSNNRKINIVQDVLPFLTAAYEINKW